MYISCSSDSNMGQNACSVINDYSIDESQIVKNMELMLDYARTVDQHEDFTTFSELHQTLYGDEEEARLQVAMFEEEGGKYSNLGFEGYINSNVNFSKKLKNHMITYARGLTDFLNEERPNLNQFTEYIEVQKDNLPQSEICDDDKRIMSVYLSASQGFANWYYSHYFSDTDLDVNESNEASLRGCNFWEGLGCALLALIVGTVIAVGAAALILAATVKIIIDGVLQPANTKVQEDLAFIAALAGFIFSGVNVYKWCCGRDEVPVQICEAPTGATYMQTGCNEYVYRIFGPSDYEFTQWENVNTNPDEATTSSPRLKFSVPSFGDLTKVFARVSCMADGSTIEAFEWQDNITFESDVDLFPLFWSQAPPANILGGSEIIGEPDLASSVLINVKVNTPSNQIMKYQWEVNEPHLIVNGGGTNENYATINLGLNSQTLITRVRAINTCLNETESLTYTTNIN